VSVVRLISLQYPHSGKIIKDVPGSVASGTHGITMPSLSESKNKTTKTKTYELSSGLPKFLVKLRQNSELTLLVRNYINEQSITEYNRG